MHTERLHWGKPADNLCALMETVLFRDTAPVHRRRATARRSDRVDRRSAVGAPAKASIAERGWLDRLEDWMARGRQRELDRYLARSVDIFDLERRLQSLTRDPHFGAY